MVLPININVNNRENQKKSSFELFKHKKGSNKFVLVFLTIIIIEILYDSIKAIDINYLKKPSLFVDEICSYNGVVNTKLSNETSIVCECNAEYANDERSLSEINGVKVQCSYFRKRKFITVFFSIFLPFGVEYLYLEHYLYFSIIFIMCCTAIIGNCIRFTVSSGQEKYFKNKLNLCFFILLVIMIIFSIINVILMFIGVKDGNNIDVLDDLHLLVNIQTERSDT
jgi:hypothetical protein